MKFMHLADAHLDSPFQGLSFLPSNEFNNIKQSTQKSFTKAIDTALDQKVDLVLIAGDTFDSVHPSPQSQLFFNREVKRLTDQEIQVVMILGNHDYLNPDEMILPQTSYFKLLGPDEQVETADFKTKSEFPYTVTGFSYQHNHIEVDKISEFPKRGDNFTIGLMHAGFKMRNGRGSTVRRILQDCQTASPSPGREILICSIFGIRTVYSTYSSVSLLAASASIPALRIASTA